MMHGVDIDETCVTTIRTLAIDAVQGANSGHPGTPMALAPVAYTQAAAFGWDRYVGLEGATIAMHSFGTSAPMKDVMKKFGFTPEAVAEAARKQAGRS